MDYFYTTIENQVREDGGRGLLFDHFDDLDRALSKLYTILAAASISNIPYHSGHLLRSDGIMIEGRVFDRRNTNEDTEAADQTIPGVEE